METEWLIMIVIKGFVSANIYYLHLLEEKRYNLNLTSVGVLLKGQTCSVIQYYKHWTTTALSKLASQIPYFC